MVDKEMKELDRKMYENILKRTAYLEDSEQLKEYIEKRKAEEKQWIKKIQTWSLDELVKETLEKELKKADKDFELEKEYVFKTVSEVKQYAMKMYEKGRISPKAMDSDIPSMPTTLTYRELIELTIEELVEKEMQKREGMFSVSEAKIKEEYIYLKNRYKGITEEELDDYIDLIIQKEILNKKSRRKEDEIHLQELQKGNKNYKESLQFDFSNLGDNCIVYHGIGLIEELNGDDLSITSIRELDMISRIKKESRKESISDFIKACAVFGGTTTVLSTLVSALGGATALETLIAAVACPSVIIALVGAIFGTVQLTNSLSKALHNKKVVRRLKESGIYNLCLEIADVEKKIEEFETSKGMSI